MIVIIGVNVVVYAVCKYARRFNSSLIHIKGVVRKSNVHEMQIGFCEFDVSGVHIGFAIVQGVFHKIECILISLKFKGSFVNC